MSDNGIEIIWIAGIMDNITARLKDKIAENHLEVPFLNRTASE
jgi:hypothetical protein